MDSKSAPVKPGRRYDSQGRRQQALRTRQAVLDAAQRLFLADGYAATTVSAIATAGGVSVETVYKAFGGKAGLVRAVRDRALAGEGPVHAEDRSEQMRLAESDPAVIIRKWAGFTTEIMPQAAPVLLLVSAGAAASPDMAALREEMDSDRRARMAHNARFLHQAGHLDPGVTVDQAADVMWLYSSPELYELLVLRRGWPLERYGKFIAEAMIAALLPRQS
jgi:AcrR family transcriptional regulator